MILQNQTYPQFPITIISINYPFSRGKRRAQRWYITDETERKEIIGVDQFAGFDSSLPSEWESWLRHRRADPPQPQEVSFYCLFIGVYVYVLLY